MTPPLVERRHPHPHVMFVVNNYPPRVGGVEMHVGQLASHLVRLGARVTVFTLDNEHQGGRESGVDVHRLRGTRALAGVLALPRPGARKALTAFAANNRVDVISTHTRFFPMSYLGVRAAGRLGLPVVHTEHGSGHVRGVASVVALASRIVDLTLGRYVLRHATLVLGVSTAVADFVRQLAGVPCRTFVNGIPVADLRPEPTVSPDDCGHRLVFVGRIVPGKGWDRVIRIAERLVPDFPDLAVHIIGDGPRRDVLAAQVAASPIRDHVTVHGRLAPADIAPILRGAVLVNPTSLAEGFQTTLLESVAAGGLVVSSPVAAARTLREMGAAVRVVQSDDEDDAWLGEIREALRDGWSPTADSLVDTFDWTARAQEYLDLTCSLSPARSRARRAPRGKSPKASQAVEGPATSGQSPCSRRLVYSTEARFRRDDGGRIVTHEASSSYEAYARWIGAVSEVTVVARVRGAVSAPVSAGQDHLVEGPHVSVLPVADFETLTGLALRVPAIVRTVWSHCTDPTAVYGGRFPGALNAIVLLRAMSKRWTTFIDVVGDPRGVLQSGVLGPPGRLIAGPVGYAMGLLVRRADAVRYVSREFLQAGYPARSNALTLACSDTDLPESAFRTRSREDLALHAPARLIAVGSQDLAYKGHDLLIDAIASLRAGGRDIDLFLVGDGRLAGTLLERAIRLGFANHVHFVGHVRERDRINGLLDEADLFVMPSRTEGVPRALAEAMARGVPAIGSDVGGIPEILPPIALFRPDDVAALTERIANLLDDLDLRTALSQRGVERARTLAADSDPRVFVDFLARITHRTGREVVGADESER